MKRCNVCGIEKQLKEFGTDKSRIDGHQYRCRPCHKLMIRRWVVRENRSPGPKPIPIEVRFWSKVIKKDGCWGWSGSKTTFGYGKIKNGEWFTNAHRISWQIHFGDIPKGQSILHKCDNPECTNPDHLFLGSQRDNMRDMLTKRAGKMEKEAGGINDSNSQAHGV